MSRRPVAKNSRRPQSSQRERVARLGALIAAGATAGAAQAATITVNSLADTTATDAQCTLREALNNANGNSDTTGGDCAAGSGADTIQFQAGLTGSIVLGGTQLSITDSTTISGPGVAALTVSGNNASRIFYIYNNAQALAVTISGLTLTQGNNTNGSAVRNKGEDVTLSAISASANTGDAISAVVSGSLTLQSSTVTGTVTGRGVRADHINSVSITNSTLSNNSASGKGAGAFLYRVGPGAVSIDSTTISGNASTNRGGGLFLYDTTGPVSITNSRITGNSTTNRGGGIALYKPLADVTIVDTTISGNTSTNRGGGIFFYKQAAGLNFTLRRSTVSGNAATGSFNGGGIYFYKQAGSIIIEDSTISGNTASNGGGIHDTNILASATLSIRNSTINGNTATVSAGNASLTSFSSVTVSNSIIANGSAPANPDLQTGAANVTLNYSLLEDTTGATFTGANNITGVDPQLGPLANNGGLTQTHLPAITSPVINAGDPAFVPPPATDQRGLARVAGGRVDMGSVELNGGVVQFSSATYSVGESGGSVTITITRTGGADPATVNYATSDGTALQPGDYTTTAGTANFAAGATTATFNVPITNDAVFEATETFNVTLSSPSADATLGAPSTAAVTITDDDLALADLAITKSVAGAGPFISGTPITFNIAVSNAGPNSATSVTVTDVLPAGATFNTATPSQGSCSGTTTITCTLGTIVNGGSATIALSVTPTTTGPLSNTATVTTASSDTNPANNAATSNVNVLAPGAIPFLDSLGKILLGLMTALTGWFMTRKQS
jgi:uncharacterized repeat protein (TIGR01451 family)/CSLREA domain-containing protein